MEENALGTVDALSAPLEAQSMQGLDGTPGDQEAEGLQFEEGSSQVSTDSVLFQYDFETY